MSKKYNIYATLFDSFEFMVGNEDFDHEDIINRINRIETADQKAIRRMELGTALNDLIDVFLTGSDLWGDMLDAWERQCEDAEFNGKKAASEDGKSVRRLYPIYNKKEYLIGNIDVKTLKQLLALFEDSVSQLRVETTIKTDFGDVCIYGYMDYAKEDIGFDLKTTGNYDLNKYYKAFQKDIYGLCLFDSGSTITEFKYVIVTYSMNTMDVATFKDIAIESFPFNYETSLQKVKLQAVEIIKFIEKYKERITDKKIFNIE